MLPIREGNLSPFFLDCTIFHFRKHVCLHTAFVRSKMQTKKHHYTHTFRQTIPTYIVHAHVGRRSFKFQQKSNVFVIGHRGPNKILKLNPVFCDSHCSATEGRKVAQSTAANRELLIKGKSGTSAQLLLNYCPSPPSLNSSPITLCDRHLTAINPFKAVASLPLCTIRNKI